MNSTAAVAKYCLFAASSGACAVAIALRPSAQDIPKMVPVGQGTAYLDCTRIQSQRVREQDLVAPCTVVASTSAPRSAN